MNNYTRKETDRHGNIFYYNDKAQLHRLDGPAVEEVGRGKFWYVDGKLHRADGPAIEYADDRKSWYVNGKLHRTDGPAAEYSDGGKHWYINHELLTEKEFNKHPLVVEYRLGKIIGEVLNES